MPDQPPTVAPPPAPRESYNPHSLDAVLATLLAQQEALSLRLDQSETETRQFRRDLCRRLDDGSDCMGRLGLDLADVKRDLGEVKLQTTKTNGRVTAHDALLKRVVAQVGRLRSQVDTLRGGLKPFLWLAAKAGTVVATLVAVWHIFDWLLEKGLLRFGS